MNKKIIGIIVLVVIVVVIGFVRQSASTDTTTVKIGNVLFMTGPLAALGEHELNGMKLAEEHVNAAGGIKGKPLEIVTEDYAGDPKKAVTAYEALRSRDLDLILFDGGSAIGPLGPLVRKDTSLSMVPIGVTHSYIDGNSRTCRIGLTTRDYGKTVTDYVANTFPNPKVAFLVTANEYGKAVQNEISQTLEKKGGKVILAESYEHAAADFRTQATKLKAQQDNIDVLVVINATSSIEPMLRQLKQIGFTKPIVSDMFTILNPALKDRSVAEGVTFIDYPFTSEPAVTDTEKLAKFKKEYSEKHHSYPGAASITAYDAVMVLATAMNRAKDLEPENISTYLTTSLGEYEGVSGKFEFNSDCEVERESVMRVVKEGKLELVK